MNTSVAELVARLQELTHLKSTLGLLWWDSEVYMPPKGVTGRAQTVAYISRLLHRMLIDPDLERVLSEAEKSSNLSDYDLTVVRETRREVGRERKLPDEFVTELAQTISEAPHVWAEARKQSNFAHFQPYLEKIVGLKRREAELVGFHRSPYDALLDVYEPYLTTEETFIVLEEVKDFLVPFLKKILSTPNQPDPGDIQGIFQQDKQRRLNGMVAQQIGFNLEAGRIDSSTHPFTMGIHPDDVRMTTRFDEHDVLSSLMTTLHEAGHGLYEQGLLREHFGTPLAEATSLGIHESQSRLWENMVGRNWAFWQYLYPQIQEEFPKPFANIPLVSFYRIFNAIEPSLIRVEADEVTYNLHIILRFEIEKELIEGSILVADLPDIWSSKIKDYLGITVPDDAQGVLQDIHWSSGLIGYFPTYTLGTLYAAQFYQAAQHALPQLDEQIVRGEFNPLRQWLQKNIHIHGKRYSAAGLLQKATGRPPSSQPFIHYITKKYEKLYGIDAGLQPTLQRAAK